MNSGDKIIAWRLFVILPVAVVLLLRCLRQRLQMGSRRRKNARMRKSDSKLLCLAHQLGYLGPILIVNLFVCMRFVFYTKLIR